MAPVAASFNSAALLGNGSWLGGTLANVWPAGAVSDGEGLIGSRASTD